MDEFSSSSDTRIDALPLEERSRPQVSILMAEYNTPVAHLEQSLQSIVNQSYANFELILVDDGGVNDVTAIVRTLNDSRIRVIDHGGNRGFSEALKTGIAASKAGLIARMDTDDIYDPGHLEHLVEVLAGAPQFSAISTRGRELTEEGPGVEFGTTGEVSRESLRKGNGLIHPASLIRKNDLVEVGGYPTEFRRAEDYALWCELILGGKRLFVDNRVTFSYRISLQDYKKRKLSNRAGQLRAYMHYFPKLNATILDYKIFLRTIAGGALPPRLVRSVRHRELRRQRG